MCTRQVIGLSALAVSMILCWSVAPVRAYDTDGDGVDDTVDVCNNTPPGTAVDEEGRPLGDIDQECDTDLEDYALFQQGMTGPLVPAGVLLELVPGGEFEMGDTFGEGDPDELPVHTVYLSPYYIAKYEVTNARYAEGLNWAFAQGLIEVIDGVVYEYGAGTSYPYCDTTSSSSYSRITWNGSTFGVLSREDHPVAHVSWYGSVAYCNWRSAMEGKPPCYDLSTWTCNFGAGGYRLPTEAEWEKAARGGTPGHRFPWSDQDTIQHARCNYYCHWQDGVPYYPYDTSPTRMFHPCWGPGSAPKTSPVGFFTGALQYKADWLWPWMATSYQTATGANGYGLYDMAGNVREWCNDWYSESYYSSSPYDNPHGPTSGTSRLLRGGDWHEYATYCRCASRIHNTPGTRSYHNGFRLALDSP